MRPADELGPILVSRSRAADLRQKLEAELEVDGAATIDFTGAVTMSPSFADELIAKLPQDAREHVELVNLSEDLRALVDYVTAGRPVTH